MRRVALLFLSVCGGLLAQITPPSGGGGGAATWGFITGTLSSQTDLNTALGLKAPLAGPTFTGVVTIPSGGVFNTPTSINLANATFPSLPYLPIGGGTLTGGLLFTDATYDIGASGATRPRNIFLSGNATIGGTLGVTGLSTLTGGATIPSGGTLTIASGGTLTCAAGSTCPSGSGTVTVVGGGSLTSTAIVTGGGTQTVQTPSATATLDSSGNASFPGTLSAASGSFGSSTPAASVCAAGTGGMLCLNEGTTPTGTLSTTDVLWGNSSTHRLGMINNNGTNVQVVGTGGDINTSDQVTNLSHVSTWGNAVNASSPGAGIAHFAGSTQTVTSSAVTSSDATGNTSGSGNFVLVTGATMVTPALGAATATSLLATGIVDGAAPVTVTTGATATLGGTYKSGYTFNQEGTAATAITYTLPTAAAGLQYCVANSYNGSAADTGTLEILTSASGQYIIFTDGTLSATGGYVISAGAARDSACVVGVDSTHWLLYPSSGTWAKH